MRLPARVLAAIDLLNVYDNKGQLWGSLSFFLFEPEGVEVKMKIILKKEAVIICLVMFTVLGCITETQYLENDSVDNIVLREPLTPPPPEPSCIKQSRFRVVSLKRLQEAARAGLGNNPSPNAVGKMCGLNTIEGFLYDRQNKDLLIFGKVVERVPPILLEDFVVAFRTTCKKYVVKNVFTPPGCTIAPPKRTLSKLEALEKRIRTEASGSKWNTHRKTYEKTCKEPQAVKVQGVPSQTHFASILVKADYDMKRIVNGSDPVNIPGFVDLYSLHSYNSRKSGFSKKRFKRPKSTLNRFWFKPTEYHFTEQNDLVVLDEFKISLLTEEQYYAEDNRVTDRGRVDPFAEKVANGFNTYYKYIAQKRRVFRQLKELMRMYVVLDAMYNKDAHLYGGLNFDYFLNSFRVPKYTVASSLPGLSRYVIERYERDTFEESQHSQFVFPMCGGVSFDIFLKWEDFRMIGDSRLSGTINAILRQKPRDNAIYWDVVMHQKSYRRP